MSGVLIAAVFILQTGGGGPTHKQWDTGAPISAALVNRNLDRPISLTDPSTEEEACVALDMDHYIVVNQYGVPTGQQGGEGNVPLSYLWSCSAGSVTQGYGENPAHTLWTAPTTAGFCDIEAAVNDIAPFNMGPTDTGTRDDPVTYAGYASDNERAAAVGAGDVSVATSGTMQGSEARFNATDDGDDLYCTVPGDPLTDDESGFFKRVELSAPVTPHMPVGRNYRRVFAWRQDMRGVIWADGAVAENYASWTSDGPAGLAQDVSPYGDWNVYMSDCPGLITDVQGNAGAGDHTHRWRNTSDSGPFEFRNAVLYYGWRVTTGWDDTPEWTRNLLLYSNDSTGNKWVPNANN